MTVRRASSDHVMASALAPSPDCEDAYDWHEDAPCRLQGDLFFDQEDESSKERKAREAKAKAICADCSSRVDCLAEAIQNSERYGIWGGLTSRERRALHHARTRELYEIVNDPQRAASLSDRERMRVSKIRNWHADQKATVGAQ